MRILALVSLLVLANCAGGYPIVVMPTGYDPGLITEMQEMQGQDFVMQGQANFWGMVDALQP